VYDVSGVQRVEFKYRIDSDGLNPIDSYENETYAGGAGVGEWQTLTMTRRHFPKEDPFGNPDIDFSVMPQYIADEYYVHVTDLQDVLIDYYVEAEDSVGNVSRSPIQHVWIAGGGGHIIDGSLDPDVSLLASNGSFDLYADWDGEYLYVATQGVGVTSEWDHFIIIGVDLSTPVSSPWAKAGVVADRTLYIGNEDSNNWCGWFDQYENVLSSDVSCASGEYLEGMVRLETYLGNPLPDGIYLAVGAYESPDGGSLMEQCPAGNGDIDIDDFEFVYFSISTSGVLDIGTKEAGSAPAVIALTQAGAGLPAKVSLTVHHPITLSLRLYDIRGHLVRSLALGFMEEGQYEYEIGGGYGSLSSLSPGIYFLELRLPNFRQTEKVLILK